MGEEESKVARAEHEDWFLQDLVEMVNTPESEMGFGITLFVGGSLISGVLIGGRHYFAGFGHDFASGIDLPEEERETLQGHFSQFGSIYDRIAEKEPDDVERPHYIHLKDAHVFAPGSGMIPENRGVWWRGRVEAVDGFVLGLMSAKSS